MKTLFLLRHAKSSWDNASLSDFERTLNARGREAAPRMGRYARELGITPDLVICSPAERAKETCELFSNAAGFDLAPRYDRRIYEASVSRLVDIISEVEDEVGTLLLIGHNPAFEELLERLTGERERMQTAALARLSLDVKSWKEIREGAGRLESVVRPKELPHG